MASLVATGVAGDGQTSQVTQLSVVLPAGLQTGDRINIIVNSSDSAMIFGTLPSGMTVADGPRANSTNQSTAVLIKQLSSSDSSTTLVIPWTSGSARAALEWAIYRGVSGSPTVFVNQDTAAVTTFVMPTTGTISAGSVVQASTHRRRSGASANNTVVPSPYTGFTSGTNNDYATAYATSVNVFGSGGYALNSGTSAGGESFVSGGVSSLGTNYVLVYPTSLNKVKVGSSSATLKVGSTAVSKAYVGATQVWP